MTKIGPIVLTALLMVVRDSACEKKGSSAGYYHVHAKPLEKRLFNTSISVGVPLFSFTIPRKDLYHHDDYHDYHHDHYAGEKGPTLESIIYAIDPLNQFLYGLVGFGLVALLAIFAMFVGNDGSDGRGGRDLYQTPLFAHHDSYQIRGILTVEDVGLHPNQCLQKTLCQTARLRHNFILGVLLPYVFQYDAKKDESSIPCEDLHECLFDPVTLIEYVTAYVSHWFASKVLIPD